ncbi:MAG: agmatinase [Candidatus Nezhaarchaeales archaeon]
MSAIDLYVTRTPYRFFELERDPHEADLVLLGFPYDSTSSFRVGSRFAPQQLRIYSAAIEGYVWELEIEISDVKVADAGDVMVVHGDTMTSLNRLKEVVQVFRSLKKRVGVVGGEHTLTLGSVHGCNPKSLIVFDAHLDLREEYPYGQKLSHATWLRRLLEGHNCEVAVVGVKATSREELENAKRMNLTHLTFKQVKKSGMKALDDVLSTLSDPLYVSVDVDVLDPAYAPGVTTPEPLGFTLQELLDGLWYLKDREILGFDVVEVCPPYDNGSTCISACKILMDLSIMSLSRLNLVN